MSPRVPAILGGSPAFPDGLRLLRPTLPPLADIEPGLHDAFVSGMVTKGPALEEYERRLADHLGVAHAVAVSSCTAGLMLVFDAFRGGEAIMPSFTFMATATAAVWAGLTPVFCDIDAETWTLDPRRVEEALRPRTSLIVPVHVFGAPADQEAFEAVGARAAVAVVYDAAHGFGALHDDHPVGLRGLAQVFSTSPTKLLITAEGGVVATGDDELAARLRTGREYGNAGDHDPAYPGFNARLSEMGALLGLASLELLEGEARRRNTLAGLYRRLLEEIPGISFQRIRPGDRSSYKDFSIRIRAAEFGLHRDQVARALEAEGVATRAYYVPPAHRMRAFARGGRAYDAMLPETDALCDEVLTLPLYGALQESDVERVAACILSLHEGAAGVAAALAPSPAAPPGIP
jgi:dTDP-4-amino-4,6-dideoxygalactose transaminase